jgi:hypothetical protein
MINFDAPDSFKETIVDISIIMGTVAVCFGIILVFILKSRGL